MSVQKIYTDGSCLSNPDGPSGWSFCLPEKERVWLVSGGEPSSTNNRMELTAVIEALRCVSDGGSYVIYTDSLLTLNCATGKWKRKSNVDLWKIYEEVSVGKTLSWVWVKAHNGDMYNEMVDTAARNEAKNQKNKNIEQ